MRAALGVDEGSWCSYFVLMEPEEKKGDRWLRLGDLTARHLEDMRRETRQGILFDMYPYTKQTHDMYSFGMACVALLIVIVWNDTFNVLSSGGALSAHIGTHTVAAFLFMYSFSGYIRSLVSANTPFSSPRVKRSASILLTMFYAYYAWTILSYWMSPFWLFIGGVTFCLYLLSGAIFSISLASLRGSVPKLAAAGALLAAVWLLFLAGYFGSALLHRLSPVAGTLYHLPELAFLLATMFAVFVEAV